MLLTDSFWVCCLSIWHWRSNLLCKLFHVHALNPLNTPKQRQKSFLDEGPRRGARRRKKFLSVCSLNLIRIQQSHSHMADPWDQLLLDMWSIQFLRSHRNGKDRALLHPYLSCVASFSSQASATNDHGYRVSIFCGRSHSLCNNVWSILPLPVYQWLATGRCKG